MTFWSLAGLDAKVAKRDVLDIPNIGNLGKPLTFTWGILLERQSLHSSKPLAIGKGHQDLSLTEVNKGNIVFYLNHAYNIAQKSLTVKPFFHFSFNANPCQSKGCAPAPRIRKPLIIRSLRNWYD